MTEKDILLDQILSNLNITKDEFTTQDRYVVCQILNDIEKSGKSNLLDSLYKKDYDEIPVSIDRFLEDPKYLGNSTGNGTQIWSFWRKQLREMFRKDKAYTLALFGGSIGIGKSTIACFALDYVVYKLLCLKDPATFYHIMADSKPGIALFNITLEKGMGVAYSKLMSSFIHSPWFNQHGSVVGSSSNPTFLLDKNITIGVGSCADHFIGLDIFASFMDEISFKDNKEIDITKMKAYDALNNILRRMESRFATKGITPGIAILASSARTEDDFLTQFMEKNSENGHALIIQKPLWEVKPKSNYRGETFTLAIDTTSSQTFIMENNAPEITDLKDRGFEIYNVPVEHRKAFEEDTPAAIRDILGKALKVQGRFIEPNEITEVINKSYHNCFKQTLLPIGFYDNSKLTDFLDFKVIDPVLIRYPIFVHHDLSLSGDTTGLYFNAVAKDAETTEMDKDEISTWRYIPVGWLKITPLHKGEQIPLNKIQEGVLEMRRMGFNIVAASADGYQSAQLLQYYRLNGLPSYLLSVDKAPSVAYMFLRNLIYGKKIILPDDEYLFRELSQLLENRRAAKVDHPQGGAKDLSDGCAGSVQCAVEHYNKGNKNIFSSSNFLFSAVLHGDFNKPVVTNTIESMPTKEKLDVDVDKILEQIHSGATSTVDDSDDIWTMY